MEGEGWHAFLSYGQGRARGWQLTLTDRVECRVLVMGGRKVRVEIDLPIFARIWVTCFWPHWHATHGEGAAEMARRAGTAAGSLLRAPLRRLP